MCNECIQSHESQCKSSNLIPVKYSHRQNQLFPFCAEHDCYCIFYCNTCFAPVCVYCKEWTHDNEHNVIDIIGYGEKFNEPLNNCHETASQRRDYHKKVKTDMDSSVGIEMENLANHLAEVKFSILSKLLYTFDYVEKQMKEDFKNVYEDLQSANDKDLKEYQTILERIDGISTSSSFVKMIRTTVITDTLNSMSESIDDGFTVSLNSSLTNEMLEKSLSKLIMDGIGSVRISFRNKSISPKLEEVFNSSGFASLNDVDKRKEYCEKSGIFFTLNKGMSSREPGNRSSIFSVLNEWMLGSCFIHTIDFLTYVFRKANEKELASENRYERNIFFK